MLSKLASEKTLERHLEWCPGLHEKAPQRVAIPVKGVNDFEGFKNYGRMINAPCVIIADFEADNKKCDEAYGGSMRKLAEQKANSFCYLVHWIDTGDVWGPFLYRGENATQEFVQRIDQELVKINEVLAIKHERKVTEEDKKKFAKADTCWICKGKFAIDTEEIERLEDKITYLKEKLKNFKKESAEYNDIQTTIDKATKAIASKKAKANKTPIPVIFHNLRDYDSYLVCDSHLVCESVGRSANALHIQVIAETFERYKSMKVDQLKYIDNQQFINNSLANLTKNLGNNHPITSQHFKDFTPGQISLATRKGIYCYNYINFQDRFLETELPPIHEFTTTLKGKISQEDYHHAQKPLCLCPSLSWDAMLKKTGVKIELFTDMSMHDFIEKVKRDGISKACKRYFKANNPKMGQAFNLSKPTSWISYVDANNLYGWAMSQFLPIGNYQWEANQEYLLKNPAMQKKYLEKILKTKANAPCRYFLNIKSHFPLKTHDYLRDLPPAVENVAVGKDWLSSYNEELVNNLDGGCFSKTEKLVPHLGLRKDYIIHYLELQYYVKLGMVIDEVSEILSFDQTNWLVPYIAFNTEK
ncbi:hypothetical protein RclHR1_08450004 [Rhizophagus clarus]|uniref:DNA-directed DNA polymerase n=1 Tax=Rhizophagus clarus TaxID=94130 RepID=A0A2Z6S0Z7_9GLOM|nr:hypothetical protein RclHR1_08450004 [Rhizophagus clarus]